MTTGPDLVTGELALTGRVTTASNATFVGEVEGVVVVYKPVVGERPLWDFPDGDLASREVASWHVSEALGWDVVPRTWLRDGPLGPGMVQRWQDIDPDQDAVDLVPAEDAAVAVAEGTVREVLDAVDEDDQAVTLVHEDSVALRRMAVFDVVTNNADRKGGHVLEGVWAGTRLTYDQLRRFFNEAIKRSGLAGRGFTCHKLRHTFATSLLRGGMSLDKIQRLMGHQDISTTTIYAHTLIDESTGAGVEAAFAGLAVAS